MNKCYVCGDELSCKYYTWKKDGEYKNKRLCNKHYNQLLKNGGLLDTTPSEHKKKHKWTNKEELLLEELYKDGRSLEDISKTMGFSMPQIIYKASAMNLGSKYMRKNNVNFKAVYQDYDWCFEKYINQGMTHDEMAKECGVTKRVIEKWCCGVHKLNNRNFKELKKLSSIQYQLILFGTLGDGHIDKRENFPIYIESHAEDEKDYIFWKYEILKNICNSSPRYYKEQYNKFTTDKMYLCKPTYRLETKVISQLKEIRNMKRIEKIRMLNEFGLSLHCLDDGSRNSSWELCLAEYTQEEIDLYVYICNERFGLKSKQKKDGRYIVFDAKSSRKIDEIILNNIPNNLDIINKKITKNIKVI